MCTLAVSYEVDNLIMYMIHPQILEVVHIVVRITSITNRKNFFFCLLFSLVLVGVLKPEQPSPWVPQQFSSLMPQTFYQSHLRRIDKYISKLKAHQFDHDKKLTKISKIHECYLHLDLRILFQHMVAGDRIAVHYHNPVNQLEIELTGPRIRTRIFSSLGLFPHNPNL